MNLLIAHVQRQLLDLGTQWRASTARLWLIAWLGELHGMLPAALRARLARGPQAQRLAWPLAAGADARRPLVVLLPPAWVLIQRIVLPLAATRDLQQVLAFEIDKFTPFTAEQVHFSARIESRNAQRATVLLVAVDRERMAAIIADCAALGLVLQGIEAQGPGGEPLEVELLPAALRPRASGAHRLYRGLWASAAGLVLALMLGILMQHQARVERMGEALAEQRQQAGAVEAVRRELTDTRDAADYLGRLKSARPTLSALLSELTRCLGDETWLEQLEVRDSGEVSLSGQSSRASALITQARTCHSLRDAQFQGVIQPDAQTGKDHFSLVARLNPEAADAPIPDPQ